MPWNNQNDKGGPWGGGHKGGGSPWGNGGHDNDGAGKAREQKPSGSGHSGNGGKGGNGGRGPDFEKFINKGQNTLKQTGGGGMFFVVIVAALAFWLFQCFYVVQQNERAVELRFGEPKQGIVSDGLHFRFWPIETYRTAPLTEQNITIGRSTMRGQGEGHMLSGDQNIVNVRFSVYYNIDNPVYYLFNVSDPVGTIRQVAESAMREVVGRRPIDDIYRDKREDVARNVLAIIQSTVDKYDVGVKVSRVSISEAAPPIKVAAAFNSVQQAEQERNRVIEEGNRVRASKLGLANGEASRRREEAAGDKASMIEEARGRAERFKAIANQSSQAPEMVRYRIYMETIGKVLSSPNKLILDQTKSGAVSYLPLNELIKKQKINTAARNNAANNLTTGDQ